MCLGFAVYLTFDKEFGSKFKCLSESGRVSFVSLKVYQEELWYMIELSYCITNMTFKLTFRDVLLLHNLKKTSKLNYASKSRFFPF